MKLKYQQPEYVGAQLISKCPHIKGNCIGSIACDRCKYQLCHNVVRNFVECNYPVVNPNWTSRYYNTGE